MERGIDTMRNRVTRRDVKSRTMNRFTALDEDLVSQYDYDDDEVAIPTRDGPGPSRGNNKNNNRPQNRRDLQMLRATGSGSGRKDMVYHITIKASVKIRSLAVLKQLSTAIENFRPIAPRINQGNVEFYLTETDEAEAVKMMNRRVGDTKLNLKYQIHVMRIPAPWDQIRPNVKMLIESAVKDRYSVGSNSLDLGDFANDKIFMNANVHCALFTNSTVVHVANVIARLFPSIQGLSLKGNRLRSLDYIATLVYAAPKVTELDLSSNALSRIGELERIRGWAIEKLHLENNECASQYSDPSAYASAIHTIFPRVTYLDGVIVSQNPFALENEDDESGMLLPFRPGFCPDANMRDHVVRFLLQYFSLYDGPSGEETRKCLIEAYDPTAIFTHSISFLRDSFSSRRVPIPKGDEDAYSQHIRSSHNIIFEEKWANYRDKIVYKGSMDIAVALSKLPISNHIKESFVLDFNLMTEHLMSFTLQGVMRDGRDAFKEAGDSKFFVRNFIIVPKPEGKIAIVSDIMMLTPVSNERKERFVNLLNNARELEAQQLPLPSMTDDL